jgi:hypothetical protein
MIRRLKQSSFGKALYRLSRRSPAGWPLRILGWGLQSVDLALTHAKPVNKAHNRRQQEILSAFESRHR